MFSQRQKTILFHLSSNCSGVSSAVLASILGVSTKTIKNEIKNINLMLPKNCSITYIHRKGYAISGGSEKITQILSVSSDNRQESLDSWSDAILSILMFEKYYISMENLASRLYISKSAIRKQFEDSWRLRTIIEVSPQRGLRIALSEGEQRHLLSIILTRSTSLVERISLHNEVKELDKLL